MQDASELWGAYETVRKGGKDILKIRVFTVSAISASKQGQKVDAAMQAAVKPLLGAYAVRVPGVQPSKPCFILSNCACMLVSTSLGCCISAQGQYGALVASN